VVWGLQTAAPALNPIVRFFWQYGGLALGSLAICNALYNYDSADPKNQPRIYICFVLVIIALIVHETRPYQVKLRFAAFSPFMFLTFVAPHPQQYLSLVLNN
jgi:hypothetical protein